MATYGRVEGGTVKEVITAVDQDDIDSKYEASVAAQFILDPNDEIEQGWTHDGSDFSAPGAAPAPTADMVKSEARRRINIAMPQWMIAREVSGGAAVSTAIKDYAADIRTDSATIEALTPIPGDYATNETRWTAP